VSDPVGEACANHSGEGVLVEDRVNARPNDGAYVVGERAEEGEL
jgi:hypothetical protein